MLHFYISHGLTHLPSPIFRFQPWHQLADDLVIASSRIYAHHIHMIGALAKKEIDRRWPTVVAEIQSWKQMVTFGFGPAGCPPTL